MADASIYPELKVTQVKNPNKMWAIPIFGFVAKMVILIPVFIEIWFVMVYSGILTLINSLMVLFTGKYWRYSYEIKLGFFKLAAKTAFFISGLTDKYPGFDFKIEDKFSLDLAYPQSPNRLYAIPIFGGFARIIILIPFIIYSAIISSGARLGVIVSFAPVFFNGQYPESTFELAVDSLRLSTAMLAYFSGLSDKYPSFYINKNHMNAKVILIVIALLLSFGHGFHYRQNNWGNSIRYKFDYQRDYQPTVPQQKPADGII